MGPIQLRFLFCRILVITGIFVGMMVWPIPQLRQAAAFVGDKVEDLAVTQAENSPKPESPLDDLMEARRGLRQSQVAHLVSEVCEDLKESNYRVSDAFFQRFRLVAQREESQLTQKVTGRVFLPKFESSSEEGIVVLAAKKWVSSPPLPSS